MKRRFLAVVTVLALCLSWLPPAARAAEETPHTHDCGGTSTTFTAWNGTDEITYDDNGVASVYLTQDVTRSGAITIWQNQTLNLCFNGHTITYTGGNDYCIKAVHEGVTIRLFDCGNGTGGIKMNSGLLAVGALYHNCHIYMEGGKLDCGSAQGISSSSDVVINGGEINSSCAYHVGGETVTINGGTFSGNADSAVIRVANAGAKVTVNGGTFTGSGKCAIEIDGGDNGQGSAEIDLQKLPTINGSGYEAVFKMRIGVKLNVTGQLTKPASPLPVGFTDHYYVVYTHDQIPITTGWKDKMGDADPAEFFSNNNPTDSKKSDTYRVKLNDSGEVEVAVPLYPITKEKCTDGGSFIVTSNGQEVTECRAGVGVSIQATPPDGGLLKSVTVTNTETNQPLEVSSWTHETFPYFTMPAAPVKISVTFTTDENLSLQSLTFEPEVTLNPTFSGDTTEYTATVSSDITHVVANAAAVENSIVAVFLLPDGSGKAALCENVEIPLNVGENKLIFFGLNPKKGTKKQYTVTITREAPAATGLTISPSPLTLDEGGTGTLTAAVQPEDAVLGEIAWSSSDETVATVDETGVVTGVKAGTATITASMPMGENAAPLTAECAVTVKAPAPPVPPAVAVTGVSLDRSELALTVGETAVLTHTVSPANAANKSVTWTSSDPAVAAVDGGTVTAVGPGSAAVTVTSANGHSASCTVTVRPARFTVSFDANGGSGGMSGGDAADGQPFVLPACAFTAPEGKAFDCWAVGSPDGERVQPGGSCTFTGDTTVYAVWKDIPEGLYQITGTVQQNGAAAPGVTVRLKQGADTAAEQVTGPDGGFAFAGIPAGTYNLVAEKDGITMTVMQEIVSGSASLTITLPAGKTNSVVEILDPETPPVVVGELESVFQDNTAYTPEDKQVVETGGSVEFRLAVEKQDAPPAAAQIEAAKPAGQTVGLYLDLSITKTVTPRDGAPVSTRVSELGSLIETLVPLPEELQGKAGYAVYREHGGQVDALPASGSGERFEVSGGKTVLTIFAQKYSTYAIAWSDAAPGPDIPEQPDVPVVPVQPVRPGGGSGGSHVKASFAVTVEKPAHGTAVSDRPGAASGDTVTVTVTPDSGYVLNALTVTDSRGNKLTLTSKGGGIYTFTMPGRKVTVSADFQPAAAPGLVWANPFTDIDATMWCGDAVSFVCENGLMSGYGDGRFGPDDNLSRAMLAQILHNAEGRPIVNFPMQFSDVPSGEWYAEAVRWAASEQIVTGYGGGLFGPDDSITREQLAVMLWRYAGTPAATDKELHFNDVDEAGGYALDALRWAVGNGILTGHGDGRLAPAGLATRAEAAAMLMRYMNGLQA